MYFKCYYVFQNVSETHINKLFFDTLKKKLDILCLSYEYLYIYPGIYPSRLTKRKSYFSSRKH